MLKKLFPSAHKINFPPDEFSPSPEAEIRPELSEISPPAFMFMSAAFLPSTPSAIIDPSLIKLFLATISTRPSFTTTSLSRFLFSRLTMSETSKLVFILPRLIMSPPIKAAPPAALILPFTDIKPSGFKGISPAKIAFVSWEDTVLSEDITLSINSLVGVAKVSVPTFITPLAPTAMPFGLRKNTFPPILPSLKAFNTPSILLILSCTRLIRFLVPSGKYKFAVWP